MKPTHFASLVGGNLIKLYETENFWIWNKTKFRKSDGTCTNKTSKDILDLSTIARLPDKVWLVKGDKRYLVLSMNKKDGTITLDNGNGTQFESRISKIKGYEIVKEFL